MFVCFFYLNIVDVCVPYTQRLDGGAVTLSPACDKHNFNSMNTIVLPSGGTPVCTTPGTLYKPISSSGQAWSQFAWWNCIQVTFILYKRWLSFFRNRIDAFLTIQ